MKQLVALIYFFITKVYCDQETNGGGWTVIQRRQDGSQDFYLGWQSYKLGFGSLTGEFWLGLDNIYRLTRNIKNRLRVELEDTVYAEYDYFAVSSEVDRYTLSLGSFSGTAGDSLSYHRNRPFTTKDSDGNHCAVTYKGAWWYGGCHHSNLNGLYLNGSHSTKGINWFHWKRNRYSVKKAVMKIRPV
ncbi:techylectin-5B-like [Exaiptasia diaphana]|uniref:Fibrinogen C-terminal domain-containing protein n=1 Tax=Exaiptasia diaphana TaxID=2652724 RepID=A0A913XSC6_EXADI|nr:techylectin-5B-like [Exaiptasia diaphana]